MTALVLGLLVPAAASTAAPTTAPVITPPAALAKQAPSLVPMSAVEGGLREGTFTLDAALARGSAGSTVTHVRAKRFSMVAATWSQKGSADNAPEVEVRVRGKGDWSAWRALETLGDGPTAGSAEATSARGTDLAWVGEASEIEARTTGRVPAGFSLVLIDSTRVAPSQSAAGAQRAAKPKGANGGGRPKIRSRNSWGAVASWRRGPATRDSTIRQVHLHHTAGSNSYDRDAVPGVLAGIYRYHTKSLGWSDIGYNVLVDRFGRAWVGRYGGVGRRVRGAHTLGFNHKSTGIAVIGDFSQRRPRDKVVRKIARIAAWQLERNGSPAKGKVEMRSKGSDLYPKGTRVRLPRIDGHSHTNATECPGAHLVEELPAIRRIAQRRIDRS